MRKKNTGNRILLVVLLLMTAGTLLLTAWIRGRLDPPGEQDRQIRTEAGRVSLKRYGICFLPEEGIRIRDKDTLLTGNSATAEVRERDLLMKLRPESQVRWKGGEILLEKGSLFLYTGEEQPVTVNVIGTELTLQDAAVLLSAEPGDCPATLFSGSCKEEGLTDAPELKAISSDTLADLLELAGGKKLCWTEDELIAESAERERNRQAELQEKLAASVDRSGNAALCSIRISCASVSEHMDSLKQEKKPYIPAGGEILKETELNFEEGETVLDVLERVCTAAEIPLEYNFTPAYNSYYIEGINHLYEFDCGPASGWTYTVNGEYPNYGCSSYTLSEGDSIEWLYTCDYSRSSAEKKEE